MSDTSTHYDIAVIGAGVAGLSCAYFISQHTRVVVLEQEDQPAFHSSGRSAALYIEGLENHVVSRLTKQSKDFFTSPPPNFTQRPLLHPRGGVTIAGLDEESKLEIFLQTWGPTNPDLVRISVDEAVAKVPILRKDKLSGAAYDSSWQSIEVHELLMGFQRGLRSNHGELHCNAKVSKLSRASSHWIIETSAGELVANTVINAAGAWANDMGALAGLAPLPLTAMRRTAAIIEAPDDAKDWPMVHTVNNNLYFKPESPGVMVSPQDETPSKAMDAFAEELDVAIALDRFSQITNHSFSKVLSQWAGLRTFASDRHPVLGFDPRCKHFFWLAGQGGFGVQTSPALGSLVSNALNNNAEIPADICVSRFV
ncbi:MAG: FAD-binding oxidoreductase [Gammaproteobacteria bacterium]|nr:FAD-binding oxidoreductase [Gammaproteobacteria bacterium]